MIVNWVFLEMNAINLAGNYSAVYDGWANGKAVYTILVVQNGWAGGAVKAISLTLLTIAIFFATISTAINYAQGFNDRALNWYQKRPGKIRRFLKLNATGGELSLPLSISVLPGGFPRRGLRHWYPRD